MITIITFFVLLSFFCWCIVHIRTSYDRKIDDEAQIKFIQNYPIK